MEVEESRATGWVVWVFFGGLMLVLLGTVHACVGLAALLRPEALAGSRADVLLPVSMAALARLHLVLGAIAGVSGVGLIRGLRWARVAGVLLALLAAAVDFAFAAVHPAWSVIAIALAGVVIYSIVAHGAELADAYGPSPRDHEPAG